MRTFFVLVSLSDQARHVLYEMVQVHVLTDGLHLSREAEQLLYDLLTPVDLAADLTQRIQAITRLAMVFEGCALDDVPHPLGFLRYYRQRIVYFMRYSRGKIVRGGESPTAMKLFVQGAGSPTSMFETVTQVACKHERQHGNRYGPCGIQGARVNPQRDYGHAEQSRYCVQLERIMLYFYRSIEHSTACGHFGPHQLTG